MIDWIDAIVADNRSISVTQRLPVNDGHVSQTPIAYHVRCKTHGVMIKIDALQAETVEDSIAFCKHCFNGEPPIERKSDPLARALAERLQRAKTNAATIEFIDSLNI